MGKLSAFLRPSPAGRTKEVFLDRFVDEEGNKVPFVVRSITAGENDAISRKHRKEDGGLDDTAYGNELLVECLVEPDLKDAELCWMKQKTPKGRGLGDGGGLFRLHLLWHPPR